MNIYLENHVRGVVWNAVNGFMINIKKIIIKESIRYYTELLIECCKTGHLECCKWLLEIEKDIDISTQSELCFRMACNNNNIEIAKWLLEVNPSIDIEIYDNIIFENCCQVNAFEIVKWLFSLIPIEHLAEIIINCFYQACVNDNIKIAQWIIAQGFEFNISDNGEEIFISTCIKGNIEIAIWLLKIKPNINIGIDNHYIFNYCCKNSSPSLLKIAKWFNLLRPETYIIEINPTNLEIESFYINKKLILHNEYKLKDTDRECIVCWENKPEVISCCNHIYCYECAQRIYDTFGNNPVLFRCAYCRKENLILSKIIK